MLRAIGIDPRIVDIKVGVRQGCLFLSLILFNIFLEYVIDELVTLDD